jgi:hypothetical protein
MDINRFLSVRRMREARTGYFVRGGQRNGLVRMPREEQLRIIKSFLSIIPTGSIVYGRWYRSSGQKAKERMPETPGSR